MKYDSGMKDCHNDILAAIQRMCGDDTKITENFSPNDGSPAPLRDYIKQKHGKSYHGFGSSELYVDCKPTKGITINSANIGEKLEMSWSQVTNFIRNNWDEVFRKESAENQPSPAAEEPAEADKPKLTYKDILLEHYSNFDVSRFDEFANYVCVACCFEEDENKCTFHAKCQKHWESECLFEWRDKPYKWDSDSINEFLIPADEKEATANTPEPSPKLSKRAQDLLASNADTDTKTADLPNPPVPVNVEGTTSLFDYSELDNDTAQNLRECENVIRQKTAGYFTLLGEKFKEAQTLLANHSSGTFEKWYTALGFKRQTVYNLIQRYDFLSSPALEGREDTFEALPLTLSYEVSKPDAPKELVEKVIEGDITSNAEYIKLKKELERTQEECRQIDANSAAKDKEYQRELDEANKRAETERKARESLYENYNSLQEGYKEFKDKYTEEYYKNVELKKHIEKLEKQPIDVAVQQDGKVLEELEQLREENARLKDTNIKNMIIRITLDDLDAMLNALKDKPHLRGIIAKAEILKV